MGHMGLAWVRCQPVPVHVHMGQPPCLVNPPTLRMMGSFMHGVNGMSCIPAQLVVCPRLELGTRGCTCTCTPAWQGRPHCRAPKQAQRRQPWI